MGCYWRPHTIPFTNKGCGRATIHQRVDAAQLPTASAFVVAGKVKAWGIRSPSAGERVIQSDVDLEWLLKARVAVARCGEMDCARWWNTDGQLGTLGASVLQRGFPRTHHFAQARSVFAAAAVKCSEVFALPGAMTLWWLGEDVEEAFDLQWEAWLDRAGEWKPFFEQIALVKSDDLPEALVRFGLVDASQIAKAETLNLDPNGKSLRVPTTPGELGDTPALLALGFRKGTSGKPIVPYAMAQP